MSNYTSKTRSQNTCVHNTVRQWSEVSRVTSRPLSCSCRWPDDHVTMLSSSPWLAPGSRPRDRDIRPPSRWCTKLMRLPLINVGSSSPDAHSPKLRADTNTCTSRILCYGGCLLFSCLCNCLSLRGRKLLRVVIEIDLVFSLYRVAINCEI